jgi:hypothetical protein
MPRRAGRAGAACGSAFTNTIASVVTITIVDKVRNVSTAPSRFTEPEP